MKKIRNLLKNYFLFVTGKPREATLIMMIFPMILAALLASFLLKDSPNRAELTPLIINWGLKYEVFILVLNFIIPSFFVTYFYSFKNRLILIRPNDNPEESEIYQRPLWGKIPHVEIGFPEGIIIKKDGAKRELELELLVLQEPKKIVLLTFVIKFDFSGAILACDLESLIRWQNRRLQNNTVFYFENLLQNILHRSLLDKHGTVRSDVLKWQAGDIQTKDLAEKWSDVGDSFYKFFTNLEKVESELKSIDVINRT